MGFMDALKGANMNYGLVSSPDFRVSYLTTKDDHFMITGAQSGTFEFTHDDVIEFKAIASGQSWIKWKMKFKNGKVAIITSPVQDPTVKDTGIKVQPIESVFGDLID